MLTDTFCMYEDYRLFHVYDTEIDITLLSGITHKNRLPELQKNFPNKSIFISVVLKVAIEMGMVDETTVREALGYKC